MANRTIRPRGFRLAIPLIPVALIELPEVLLLLVVLLVVLLVPRWWWWWSPLDRLGRIMLVSMVDRRVAIRWRGWTRLPKNERHVVPVSQLTTQVRRSGGGIPMYPRIHGIIPTVTYPPLGIRYHRRTCAPRNHRVIEYIIEELQGVVRIENSEFVLPSVGA